MTTTDSRAAQLAESRYRNGYGPTLAAPWEQLDTSMREFLANEAVSWLMSAIAAGLVAENPTAIVDADNPTPLRWGLNDVQWGDDGSVAVMLSGLDREPYWLELDQEQAAVLRKDLTGPDGNPKPRRPRPARGRVATMTITTLTSGSTVPASGALATASPPRPPVTRSRPARTSWYPVQADHPRMGRRVARPEEARQPRERGLSNANGSTWKGRGSTAMHAITLRRVFMPIGSLLAVHSEFRSPSIEWARRYP
ncbi:hypothetical protein [Streptomyces sp. NPDC003032]